MIRKLTVLLVISFVCAAAALPHVAEARIRINLTDANAEPLPIALVPFDGDTDEERQLGRDMREVINTNLTNSGLFAVVDQKAHLQTLESLRVSGPLYSEWRLINMEALLVGNVQIVGAGNARKVRVEFRLYDIYEEKPIIGKVYTVDMRFWRHVAHLVSDDIYTALTGEGGIFASRIVHIGEEADANGKVVKKLCVMDQDGGNYQCLTDGSHLVLTPRFNPQSQKIIYMSYARGVPRLYLLDLPTGRQEIVGDFEGLNSSPRFAPDGKSIVMTLTAGHEGNPEIYSMDLASRKLTRLTFNAGIDTSPSFSPDGKQIVFNSNRGGKPALYIMDADGNKVRRLTYGDYRAYAPEWSPRGDLIAFVKSSGGTFSISVIDPEGREQRQLTESFMDESPTWSPNGRVILFARQDEKANTMRLYSIDLTGYHLRQIDTPIDASDPAWSPLIR